MIRVIKEFEGFTIMHWDYDHIKDDVDRVIQIIRACAERLSAEELPETVFRLYRGDLLVASLEWDADTGWRWF